jgi:hypothetical protein
MSQAPELYACQVRASLRRDSSPWTTIKNGFGGIFVAVGDGGVEIYARGIPARLARRVGADYSLDAADVTFGSARIGWLGTRLFERECVVLGWSDGGHTVEVAVAPTDRDLTRLRDALIAAGAQED